MDPFSHPRQAAALHIQYTNVINSRDAVLMPVLRQIDG